MPVRAGPALRSGFGTQYILRIYAQDDHPSEQTHIRCCSHLLTTGEDYRNPVRLIDVLKCTVNVFFKRLCYFKT